LVPRRKKKSSHRFQVYSVEVELAGPEMENVVQDFSYFQGAPDLPQREPKHRIRLSRLGRRPKAGDLPPVAAERVFSDCVSYRSGERLYFEYSGAVLVVRRQAGATEATLISADPHLSHELAYLCLQSELGRYLDRQGLHRVHALGLGLPSGKSALVLLPSGGGKTTLAVELLKLGAGVMLSDDSPLIDRRGHVHPFPLRMACKPEADIPEEWRAQATEFRRRKFGSKLLIPTAAMPKACLPVPGASFRPGYVLLGLRHGAGEQPALRLLSRGKGGYPFFRDMVVGLGLPQVAELLLTHGPRSLPGLVPAAASRALAALAHIARAQVWELQLARDSALNARFLAREFREGRLS
jgi:hypothetical protein